MSNIYVALSGGVDSSVALALLRDAGHDVTGVYFKTYKPDGNRDYCREQGLDAQRVCEHLGVPFKVYDLEEEYRQKVFEYMIEGYRSGVTPNPDIMCNKEIKFGVFAQRAFADGADLIATGHYGRVDSRVLQMAVDESKDQSYFLSQVHRDVLARTVFPLGELLKSEVRELAQGYGLHTASKKDSQGICFIGQEIDVKDFLKQYIPEDPGDVLDSNKVVVGTHKGAKFSTIGERHGFTILPEHKSTEMPRLFVLERDVKSNTLTVGTKEELLARQNNIKELTIRDCSWIDSEPSQDKEYTCRIRHRGELYKCEVSITDSAEGNWQVHFIDTPYAPAEGQFVALYHNAVCLGGGGIV